MYFPTFLPFQPCGNDCGSAHDVNCGGASVTTIFGGCELPPMVLQYAPCAAWIAITLKRWPVRCSRCGSHNRRIASTVSYESQHTHTGARELAVSA